ncbi:MAG TPA: hypothetical protein VLE48_11295, partial [Terriglobales bacterium]|nr:hypothetical protein [Terriglobales bacterium]
NSAIAAYYYLRLIVVMYMRDPREDMPALTIPAPLAAVLTLTAAATLYLGILPGRVLDFAARSAADILRF